MEDFQPHKQSENIRNISFEKYYVWSNFFKRKLLEIDNKFNKKNFYKKKI